MDLLTFLKDVAPSLVAIATLWFAYLQNKDNQKKQLQQLQAQWEHEEKQAQIKGESAKAKEQRDNLQNIYANAVRSLSEIPALMHGGSYNVQRVSEEMGEAQKWLSMFIIYYNDKTSDSFKNFYTEYNLFSTTEQG